ncbi:putative quinol monooxygenase [Flammeovirga aprica]|uniref:Antibiotic biosynthesis monooxygenase n=1 Tax=Flammeovirga aprica JL-4 TaxID=694437 RepID=A0A7X9RXN2_9BACT|nr:antibiotic biosynthesis monooxygenase [Flammeovirga aprica]NME70494.1 antibiotic biosynthesis monooxygenase [Flammeovirga aprica JL-4]
MLHRFVRMSFKQECVEEFENLFLEVKGTIEKFEGCKSVELLQDATAKNQFMTFSIWENEKALDNYRQSAFFQSTWKKTKTLFNDKPKAFSMFKVE